MYPDSYSQDLLELATIRQRNGESFESDMQEYSLEFEKDDNTSSVVLSMIRKDSLER